jgi:hypothetical protein
MNFDRFKQLARKVLNFFAPPDPFDIEEAKTLQDTVDEWLDQCPRDVGAFVVLPDGSVSIAVPKGDGPDTEHPTYAPLLLCAGICADENLDLQGVVFDRMVHRRNQGQRVTSVFNPRRYEA